MDLGGCREQRAQHRGIRERRSAAEGKDVVISRAQFADFDAPALRGDSAPDAIGLDRLIRTQDTTMAPPPPAPSVVPLYLVGPRRVTVTPGAVAACAMAHQPFDHLRLHGGSQNEDTGRPHST
jgi:hypothetical protein